MDEPDFAGVTARQIISVPGPVFSQDAKEVLGIDQEPVRTIERQKYYNPYDINIDLKVMQEPSNIGGFDGTRLKGYENTMNCDADQYDASEISGRDIYEKYMARSRPILIRGLINDWPAAKEYTRFRLYNEHGKLPVTVTSIPYADKFHGEGTTTMSLSKYMDQVMNHSVVGGIHPWYVFIGHPLKGRPSPPRLRGGSRAEKDQAPADEPMGRTGGEMLHTHLVDYETVPTPRVIQEMQELITKGPSAHFDSDYKDRK